MKPSFQQKMLEKIEKGPLNSLEVLAEEEGSLLGFKESSSSMGSTFHPWDTLKTGYDDDSGDIGMEPISGEDKTRAVVIAILIVAGIAAGVVLPLLLL